MTRKGAYASPARTADCGPPIARTGALETSALVGLLRPQRRQGDGGRARGGQRREGGRCRGQRAAGGERGEEVRAVAEHAGRERGADLAAPAAGERAERRRAEGEIVRPEGAPEHGHLRT